MNQLFYIILTLLVGFCLPILASANGMLSKSLGSPLTATLGVFLVATVVISLVVIGSKSPGITATSLSKTDWRMWTGGIFVVLNIITFTLAPQKIGVGNMIILFISGQIISSVLVEHYGLLNFPVQVISWPRAIGLCFIIGGVILVKRF